MKLKTAIEYWELLFYNRRHRTPMDLHLGYAKYIDFLKQLLQLGFFIPCDKECKPLEKPDFYDDYKDNLVSILAWTSVEIDMEACKEYQQACDRVLFKGFEIVEYSKGYFYIENDIHVVAQKNYGCDWVFLGHNTIEDLSGKVDLVEKVANKFKY